MRFPGKKAESSPENDWVVQATDLVERTIDTVRDKTVVPLTTIARGLVYGLLIAFSGAAATVLFTIMFVRFLDVYLDNIPKVPEGVWFAYLVAGVLFVIGGLVLWSARSPKTQSQTSK